MRALDFTDRAPRVWPKVRDSIEVRLDDACLIVRRDDAAGPTDFGTPRYDERRYGPYACKLAAPSGPEAREGDRHTVRLGFALSLASDIAPRESDELVIASDEGGRLDAPETHTYRIQGTVNPRPAAWGERALYNVEVVRDIED